MGGKHEQFDIEGDERKRPKLLPIRRVYWKIKSKHFHLFKAIVIAHAIAALALTIPVFAELSSRSVQLSTIVTSWTNAPISDVVLQPAGTDCPDTYLPAFFGPVVFTCPEDTTDEVDEDDLVECFEGVLDVDSWRGAHVCIQRLSGLDALARHNVDECAEGETNCGEPEGTQGVICAPEGMPCPITSIEIREDTGPGADEYRPFPFFDRALYFSRNQTRLPIVRFDINSTLFLDSKYSLDRPDSTWYESVDEQDASVVYVENGLDTDFVNYTATSVETFQVVRLAEVPWAADCELTREDVFDKRDSYDSITRLQLAVMIMSIMAAFYSISWVFYRTFIPRGRKKTKNDIEELELCLQTNTVRKKTRVERITSRIGLLFKISKLVVTIWGAVIALQLSSFAERAAENECSDELGDKVFNFYRSLVDDVSRANLAKGGADVGDMAMQSLEL